MTKRLQVLLIFLASCTSPDSGNLTNADKGKSSKTQFKKTSSVVSASLGIYKIIGDSVLVPPFEIEVSLSAKAKERLINGAETIIIDVFLDGEPKDSSKVELEEDGTFFVGTTKKEISYGEVARFDDLKFPKRIYDQLRDKDVNLTVNTYTGRKSSPDNLITGDFLGGKVSTIINKRFTMKHKLIYGDD